MAWEEVEVAEKLTKRGNSFGSNAAQLEQERIAATKALFMTAKVAAVVSSPDLTRQ